MLKQAVQTAVEAELLQRPEKLVNKAFPRFLKKFIQVGKAVADYIIRAGSRSGADRGLKTYADVLSKIWSESSITLRGSPDKVEHLDSSYFTLRSFITVVAASNASSRRAKALCEDSLEAVADLIGEDALLDIETSVEKELMANRIRSLGKNLKHGPGSMLAWRFLADLPKDPPLPFNYSVSGDERDPRFLYGPEIGNTSLEKKKNLHVIYGVWYGTNRKPVDPADYTLGFSNEADPKGKVHYGVCSVAIPRTHIFGSVGTPFYERWLRFQFVDDHLQLSGINAINSEGEFIEKMRSELGLLEEAERVALVYIHGYNNSFKEAALRAAQIGFDLKVPGVTAFYSWPSHANPLKYLPDRERIEASEKQIADFLTTVVTRSNATKVHVIAHSMGNRGFVRALSKVIPKVSSTAGVKFGQIILAAADLGIDLFKDLAKSYPDISERTTLYVSAKDKALWMARYLQDADRIGFKPPVTVVDGIDTVDVANIDLTILGHGYIAEAAPVLYDMLEMIRSNLPPDKRARTQAAISEIGKKYWIIYG